MPRIKVSCFYWRELAYQNFVLTPLWPRGTRSSLILLSFDSVRFRIKVVLILLLLELSCLSKICADPPVA